MATFSPALLFPAKTLAVSFDENVFKAAAQKQLCGQFVRNCQETYGFTLPAKSDALRMWIMQADKKAFPKGLKGINAIKTIAHVAGIVLTAREHDATIILPEWAGEDVENELFAKMDAAKEKREAAKVEKAKIEPAIVTVDSVKAAIVALSKDDKESLLQYLGETLGYELAFN